MTPVVLFVLHGASFAAEREMQRLVKGESTTVQLEYTVGDAAITDPTVADFLIHDNRREVYLNARNAGAAMLTLWDDHGVQRDVMPIQVTAVDLQTLTQRARQLLGLGDTVQFVRRGDTIVMQGEVTSEEDLRRVEAFAAEETHLRSAVRLGATTLKNIGQEIALAIGRPGITVRQVKDRLLLEGIAYGQASALHAETIARIYSDRVLNLIEVRDGGRSPGKRPLIRLVIHFLELKSGALKRFGIEWTPGATPERSGSGVGSIVNTAVGTIMNFLPKLRWARERGEGRILEQPTMVVKSGEPVDFFSGTEIPYTTEQSVQFKNVGITIHAEPIAYGTDVDLKIQATLSAPSTGVQQGIDRRSVTTSAYCRSGESLVLGGLWRHGAATSRNKVPSGMNQSSALFSLALSKDFQEQRSDFLVFVTPEVLQAPPQATEAEALWERERAAIDAAETTPVHRHRRGPSHRSRYWRSGRHTRKRLLDSSLATGHQTPASTASVRGQIDDPSAIIQLPESLQ